MEVSSSQMVGRDFGLIEIVKSFRENVIKSQSDLGLMVREVPLKQFEKIKTIGTLPFDMSEMTGTALTLCW